MRGGQRVAAASASSHATLPTYRPSGSRRDVEQAKRLAAARQECRAGRRAPDANRRSPRSCRNRRSSRRRPRRPRESRRRRSDSPRAGIAPPCRHSAARTRAARAVRPAVAPFASGNSGSSLIATTAAAPRSARRRARGERLLEQARQAIEAAVRHQHDVIAGRELVEQPRKQRLHVGGDDEPFAERRERGGGIRSPRSAAPSTNTRSAAANEPCSVSRCTPMRIVFERGSMTATIRCCGARLRRPCSVVAIAVGWCAKSSYNVMPRERAAQLEAALDALELRERSQRASRARRRRGRAAAIAASAFSRLCWPSSDQRPLPRARALLEDAEARLCADRIVGAEPTRVAIARTERRERRPNAAREQPLDVRVLAVRDDEPVAGHRAQQLMELPDDRVDVRVDVGVVELDVVRRSACAAGSGRTSRACRRTPCRTRRLRRRSTSSRRAAPRCRSCSARRRSGSPGSSPRTRESTRACSSSSSCRASRRPRAPICRAARARRATAGPTSRLCPSSAALRRQACRATARCRRRRSRRRRRSAPRSRRRA